MTIKSNDLCAVIVPTHTSIDPQCERALRELEDQGYPVFRIHGCPWVDIIRSSSVTKVFEIGFEEVLFVDHDLVFEPADVNKLREHDLPFVCATYYMKGEGKPVTHFTEQQVPIGNKTGGLHPATYSGMGFNFIKKEVFDAIEAKLPHKYCFANDKSGFVPYFQPLIIPHGDENRYLPEDYAFCHRAMEAGYPLVCDTSIILWHLGRYAYSVLDAGKTNIQQFFNDTTIDIGEPEHVASN